MEECGLLSWISDEPSNFQFELECKSADVSLAGAPALLKCVLFSWWVQTVDGFLAVWKQKDNDMNTGSATDPG